jgi:hypothetical protein
MAKGGRKRKQGKREPNGQLSRKAEHMQERRAVDEEVAMSTGKKARERVHGVAAEHSGTELAGSVIGRLYLAGLIEPEQLNAARLLIDTYASYQRAVDSPRPPKAVNIGGTSGAIPADVSPENATRARSAWGTITGVIQAANNVHRGATIYAACDYIVLRDEEQLHLLPSLRLGLNAIARAYGLAEKAA